MLEGINYLNAKLQINILKKQKKLLNFKNSGNFGWKTENWKKNEYKSISQH